eukprot:CAMPEP_0181213070 /NCGR_PEP_ID=MMETSP1096-20121128/24701_1 /TAXON_ID=156174 ORGANISM="Chrysochromulina ericina, Strain CCMP281" /NCGR_SAMPLE_ID=MMETSP1096 /ASSEMBLY_ACC=CAM_ASM_000453 /LENGTH=80 /DNA_ID=CAMNT_0023304669 /DNA_START=101 /DNA_END=343 /DNA_ORIENTATION=-
MNSRAHVFLLGGLRAAEQSMQFLITWDVAIWCVQATAGLEQDDRMAGLVDRGLKPEIQGWSFHAPATLERPFAGASTAVG